MSHAVQSLQLPIHQQIPALAALLSSLPSTYRVQHDVAAAASYVSARLLPPVAAGDAEDGPFPFEKGSVPGKRNERCKYDHNYGATPLSKAVVEAASLAAYAVKASNSTSEQTATAVLRAVSTSILPAAAQAMRASASTDAATQASERATADALDQAARAIPASFKAALTLLQDAGLLQVPRHRIFKQCKCGGLFRGAMAAAETCCCINFATGQRKEPAICGTARSEAHSLPISGPIDIMRDWFSVPDIAKLLSACPPAQTDDTMTDVRGGTVWPREVAGNARLIGADIVVSYDLTDDGIAVRPFLHACMQGVWVWVWAWGQ